MKKCFIASMMLFAVVNLHAASLQPGSDIELQVQDVNPTNPHGERPRTPIVRPVISLDGHTLFLNIGYDLTLVLLDEDGEAAYTVYIPAGTSAVMLPAALCGDYEIQLYPDGSSYYFYGWVEL